MGVWSSALAELLHRQAEKLEDDPTARFVALRESYNYAVETKDLSSAHRVVKQLVREYELDELRLRIHLVAEASRAAHSPTERKKVAEYAWFPANAGSKTHPVGLKRPNAWGLHDMHGNVWEWCEDWLGNDFYSQSLRDDPTGPSTDKSRVFRGGSWLRLPEFASCAYRNGRAPNYRRGSVGFRVALTLDP